MDLSNGNLLDDKFSNFRVLGIGKPSANQISRWQAKGKSNKLERLKNKGKIPASTKTGAEEDEIEDTPITDNTRVEMYENPTSTQSDGWPRGLKITVYAVGGVALLFCGIIVVKKLRG